MRDVGLLDSAAGRPRASAFGEDVYETIDLKAAALFHSLVRNSALVDKRLALLAVVVFFDLSDRELSLRDDDSFDLTMDMAVGAISDLEEIATRLRSIGRKR